MCASVNPNEAILRLAWKYLDVCEVPGPKSNKLIQGWIKQAADWLDGDDSKTAWCGCFRGALGHETATGCPAAFYRAANWQNWGVPVDVKNASTWLPGDTIIMKRPGGFHVTLFVALKGKAGVQCLGGNQGDKVCVATYKLSDIIAVRRAQS